MSRGTGLRLGKVRSGGGYGCEQFTGWVRGEGHTRGLRWVRTVELGEAKGVIENLTKITLTLAQTQNCESYKGYTMELGYSFRTTTPGVLPKRKPR